MPNLIFQNNLKSLNRNDVLVASFPRSGNTWSRFLISDVLLQIYGFQTETKLPVSADEIIPDIYQHDINKVSSKIKFSYRLIKTHELYNSHEQVQKIIYIFRQPADVLCSHYDFMRLHNRVTVEDKAIFVLENIDKWCKHLSSYIDAKNENHSKILFISYEKLHNNTVLSLEKVFQFLNIDCVQHEMLIKAVHNHSFDKHRKLESEIRKEGENYFYRRGEVNSSADELSDRIILRIKERTQDILNVAKNLEVSDLGRQENLIN